jgi:hypothetical protein
MAIVAVVLVRLDEQRVAPDGGERPPRRLVRRPAFFMRHGTTFIRVARVAMLVIRATARPRIESPA